MASVYSHAREPEQPDSRSIVDIIRTVVTDVQEIIRAELRLARAETTEKAVRAGKGAGTLVAGVVAALFAAGFLLLSMHHALSGVIPPWLSALMIGLVVGIVAIGLIVKGRNDIKRLTPKPVRTLESFKRDVQAIKEHAR